MSDISRTVSFRNVLVIPYQIECSSMVSECKALRLHSLVEYKVQQLNQDCDLLQKYLAFLRSIEELIFQFQDYNHSYG